MHIHNQAFSLILTFIFLSSDVTNLHALMGLVHSCPAWGPMDICGFISLMLLPSSIVSSPLWVEYRSAAGHWSRHFLLLSKGIKVSLSRTESLHYYLINLAMYKWFFISWLKREAVKGDVFLVNRNRPVLLPDTKSMLSCHSDKYSASNTWKCSSLWKAVIFGGKCHIICYCWIKEQRKKALYKHMDCSVNYGKGILIVGYIRVFLCS